MIAYDLYGTKNLSLFLAREHIEKILECLLMKEIVLIKEGITTCLVVMIRRILF